MPFYYELNLPQLPCSDSDQVRFHCWLVEPDSMVEAGHPIALVECGGNTTEILTTGPGLVSSLISKPGDPLSTGQAFAEMLADGEAVPYGRPSCTARPGKRER